MSKVRLHLIQYEKATLCMPYILICREYHTHNTGIWSKHTIHIHIDRMEYRNHGTSVFADVNTRLKRSHTNIKRAFGRQKWKKCTQHAHTMNTRYFGLKERQKKRLTSSIHLQIEMCCHSMPSSKERKHKKIHAQQQRWLNIWQSERERSSTQTL